ncbi:MAG: SRPBCC family protein, partial [Pseudonocardiaceae bacterium]
YKLLTPGPVNNYRAEVRLTPRADGGTDVRWSGTFDERIPGTGKIAQRALNGAISQLATKLVRAAERRS